MASGMIVGVPGCTNGDDPLVLHGTCAPSKFTALQPIGFLV